MHFDVLLTLCTTFACMIICVAKVILYRDTPVQPKVILFATDCQAIDYTRCWSGSFFLILKIKDSLFFNRLSYLTFTKQLIKYSFLSSILI